MMKKWVVSCLAAAAFAAPGLSQAGTVVLVDSFDVPAQFVFDLTSASGAGVSQESTDVSPVAVNPPANTVAKRTVTHELLQGGNAAPPSSGAQSNAKVASGFPPGTLAITNTSGRDSKVTIEWTLPAAFIPSSFAVSPASVAFDLLLTDQDVLAELFYNDVLLGTRTLATYDGTVGFPVLVPLATYFNLTSAQQDTISSPGNQVLKLVLNGPTAWDLRLDNLRFELPEPGSLPLVALALVGAVVALNRRKAAPNRV